MQAVQQYKDELRKRTSSVKEFAEMMGISLNKAYQLTRIPGAPIIKVGRNILIVNSRLDDFLESLIGTEII